MPPTSDRTFEVTAAARFKVQRLFLTGVEVTQAIQHYGSSRHLTDPADQGRDNSLRLVARKPAWVRVYVSGRNVPAVTGTLEILQRSAGSIWLSAATLNPEAPGEVTAVANPEYTSERGSLNSTLNFIISAERMCGTLRLVARIQAGRWSDTMTVNLSVTLKQTLRMAGVMVAYNGPGPIEARTPNIMIPAPTMADLQATSDRALTILPVESTARFRSAGVISWSKPLDDRAAWDGLLAEVRKVRLAEGNPTDWIHVGLLPSGVPRESDIVGLGGAGSAVAIRTAGGSLAHELGHACGLKHAPAGDPPDPDPNYPVYEPYKSGSIGEFGLDVSNGRIQNPSSGRDFMSYGAFKWISPYSHGLLIENIRLNPTYVCQDEPWWRDGVWDARPHIGPPVPEPDPFHAEIPAFDRPTAAIHVVSVLLRVERGGAVSEAHVHRTKAQPEVEGGIATRLTARLLGKQGELLSEAPVVQLPGSAHGGCGTDLTFWAQALLPDAGPGASLEIADGTNTIWKRQAPKVPVTITAFDAKLEQSGRLKAAWKSKGQAIEFWVRYSRDGQTWSSAAIGLTGNSVELETRFLPAGKGMLQVVAHDGFFSHASRPMEITLPDRSAAEIAILHPRAGSPYVAGQTIRLWGSAVAADGGPVLTDRCSWSVDGKKAGKGLDLFIAAPRAGQHEIRFTVDSVVSSVTIECVERATQAGTKLM